MPQRCRAPGCGQFISAGEEFCRRHSETEVPTPATSDLLDLEIDVLRAVLSELHEETELEMKARYIPRIASAITQAIRTRHQISSHAATDLMAFLAPVLAELEEEAKSAQPR